MFREALFNQDISRTIEPVETFAGRTYVRSLMVREKDKYDLAVQADGMYRAHLILACCCDEHGRPEFKDEDIHRVNDMPLRLVEPIFDAAVKLNRISPADVEALRKNSETTPNGDSASASPPTSA